MQVRRAPLLAQVAQAPTYLLRAWRSGEETIEQRAQVEAGPADHNRQPATLFDLAKHGAGLASIVPRGTRLSGRENIEKMMGSASAVFGAGLGCANLEFTVERHRVAIHDLAAKALGDGQ